MCGIFGWQHTGDVDRTALAVVAAVLELGNDTRGGDSWGVSDGVNLYRGTGSISTHRRAAKLAKWDTLLAHTRFATTGSVCIDNCHPFRVTGPGGRVVIGAHNGIVYNHWELNRAHKRDCSVDSMHIFEHIANDLPLSDLRGYGAIEYVDSLRPGSVFLGKFNGGQLSVWRLYRDDTSYGVLWTSDHTHMEKALALAGLDGKEVDAKQGVLYAIHDNDVWIEDKHALDAIGGAGRMVTVTTTTAPKSDAAPAEQTALPAPVEEPIAHGTKGSDLLATRSRSYTYTGGWKSGDNWASDYDWRHSRWRYDPSQDRTLPTRIREPETPDTTPKGKRGNPRKGRKGKTASVGADAPTFVPFGERRSYVWDYKTERFLDAETGAPYDRRQRRVYDYDICEACGDPMLPTAMPGDEALCKACEMRLLAEMEDDAKLDEMIREMGGDKDGPVVVTTGKEDHHDNP